MDIDIYIDDLSFSVFADTHEQVVETLLRAGLDLHDVIRNELFSEVSGSKGATVATEAGLAEKVQAALDQVTGAPTGRPEITTPSLGADYRCGKKRGRHEKSSKRGQRFAKGKKRKNN